jgi:outer membrane biosynthesis protein TonB
MVLPVLRVLQLCFSAPIVHRWSSINTVLKTILIAGFGFALLSNTLASAQQTQSGAPAQPTSSIYNRMRRFPDQSQGENQQQNQQQQTIQTQQFPAQQFPPDQQGQPGRRPFMQFPHATAPPQQQPAAPQPQPSPQATNAQPAAQQAQQGPYGLALQPANPPKISYAGGQLTVTADNSALPDILSSVVRVTGAQLEGSRPPESERVFGQFGPGSPRDVLNSLLVGSHFDYILVGALDDPGKVRQVMLTPHGSSMQSAAASASNQPQEEPTPAPEEEENVVNVQPEPPPPPAQVNTSPEPAPGQQQVKTPEQLLQELQRLRQQQQQQQQENPH